MSVEHWNGGGDMAGARMAAAAGERHDGSASATYRAPQRAAQREARRSAHVIVCGNEKGGSGKSTVAVHLAIALMARGLRVATVDLDSRQLTLTRYLENRREHIARHGCGLRLPGHLRIERSSHERRDEAERRERTQLAGALDALRESNDFVVVDTPGFDTPLSRAAHAMANTLVTPMNDSFIDYDVLARTDPETGETLGQSQYALQVREARRQRTVEGAPLLDWVLVRNRLANIASRNERRVHESLRLLGVELGFRLIEGVTERVVYRELFQHGLTVVDEPDRHLADFGARSSHEAARREIESLVANLDLPLDSRRAEREAARARWLAQFRMPRVEPDVFAD